MSAQRRKDSKGRVLQTGEYERSTGGYEYKWRADLGCGVAQKGQADLIRGNAYQ